ncbi:hypothetical protein AVEN_196227-2, partial [Araneus ventricosus]
MLEVWLMPQLDSDSTDYIFQQDGAPPHWSTEVRTFLNQHLPKRWIGRNGDADDVFCSWPPRSPDLTPCDFFLWGYVKDRVYVSPMPKTIEEFKHPFLQGDLTKQLAKELLDRVSNPHLSYPDDDDDGILPDVPQRIASKKPARDKQRTRSELHMESVNFEPPLLTALSTSADQESSHNDVYDLPTAWMEQDNDIEVIHRERMSGSPEVGKDLKFTQQATLPLSSRGEYASVNNNVPESSASNVQNNLNEIDQMDTLSNRNVNQLDDL